MLDPKSPPPPPPPTFTRINAVFLGLSFVIYVIQLHEYIFACLELIPIVLYQFWLRVQ